LQKFNERSGATMHDPELLTPREVARLLRVSRETVYAKIRNDELGAIRLGRGANPVLRIPSAEVQRLLEEGATRQLQEVAA
jgi:excisionase family DNA binding protein